MRKRTGLILWAAVIFSSCEKSISFTPENADPLLVVEATIENDQAPVVILSTSVNYFSEITPEILANSFVRNANIEISNGILTHKLKEYTIPDVDGYNLYYYSIDSANLSTAFLGEFDKTYFLEINNNGKVYSATTTIPSLTKKIDSLWWEKAPATQDSDFVKVVARVTDPAGFGNYIRYFTKRNQQPFWPGLNSVFDDQIVDGKTYDVQIDRGVNRNEPIDQQTYALFNRGDTVTVKQCNVDKATYDFWRTIEYSYGSIGNPFSSPTKVLSNIKGGALGYFGGYAAQFRTIIIPQ